MARTPNRERTDGGHEPKRVYERLDAGKQYPQYSWVFGECSIPSKMILESITDGFLVLDKNWCCTYVNGAGAAFFGTTPDRLIGRSLWEVLPQTRQFRFQKEYTRALEQQTVVEFEEYYEPLGRWYTCRCHPVADGLTVFFSDITERKRIQEALRRTKQREAELLQRNECLANEVQIQTDKMRATIDRLQDEVARRVLAESKLRRRSQMFDAFFQHTITPLAFLDRAFNFIQVNDAYARADGKRPEHFIGRNHFALYPDAEMQAIFEQVVETRQPCRAHARPFTYPGETPRRRYLSWQLTPLLSEAGKVKFLVFSLEDVTDQQMALQELQQRAQQLQTLTLELSQAEDRERRRLAEILHDDLQQVLAAAKFHLGMLSTRVRSNAAFEELTDQVDVLLKEAINKSRSLSHELSPAVLYQSDLGETFEWLARQLEAKHGLVVHVEVRGLIDPRSEPLRTLLYKAAQEMLFNVVKHARVGEARLRLQYVRGRLWMTISDRGRGFDPHTLGKAGGFGLLSIRERVQSLGGRIRIRSFPGKGSTFLIAVPDAQAVVEPPAARARIPGSATAPLRPSPSPGHLRVLLVDDHRIVRQGLAALLGAERDIKVVGQASNSREAVEMAKSLAPDVIVMDVAMPVMSGDQATSHIRRHLPQIRIVALSMLEEPSASEKMLNAGASVCLRRTSPVADLLSAIRGGRCQ